MIFVSRNHHLLRKSSEADDILGIFKKVIDIDVTSH